jgi:hypothetical protein
MAVMHWYRLMVQWWINGGGPWLEVDIKEADTGWTISPRHLLEVLKNVSQGHKYGLVWYVPITWESCFLMKWKSPHLVQVEDTVVRRMVAERDSAAKWTWAATMLSPLVIVHHRLNKVGSDKLELFAVGSVAAAIDPKESDLQQLTHRAVRAAFHPRSVIVAY